MLRICTGTAISLPSVAVATLDDVCFFISPIGAEGSEERERSDRVLEYIVRPAVEPHGLRAVRGDEIGLPGQITHQVVEHVLNARAAVADLTGGNANVYYELAVRHAAKLPVVLIAGTSERKRLPFDTSQMRTIFFDHTDLKSADNARQAITEQMTHALAGAVDSPIATAINLQALESGSGVEQVLADLVGRVDRLAEIVGTIPYGIPAPGGGVFIPSGGELAFTTDPGQAQYFTGGPITPSSRVYRRRYFAGGEAIPTVWTITDETPPEVPATEETLEQSEGETPRPKTRRRKKTG